MTDPIRAQAGRDLPPVTDITRWRYQPGDRLIVRVDAHQISHADAAMVRDRIRHALALPGDAPVAVLTTGWQVSVISEQRGPRCCEHDHVIGSQQWWECCGAAEYAERHQTITRKDT